ncbi:hypothetical protein Vafri_2333, partial [Volvox africanus]
MEADSIEGGNDTVPASEAPQPREPSSQPPQPPQQVQQPQHGMAMQQQQPVLLPPQSAHHSHAPERPSVDQGALQASPRPPGNVRMSSPAHGSTPLALRLIASWGAARNPDATPQTPPQVQLPNSWLDSSAHSSAFSVVPGGGESREVPVYPRTGRHDNGSCSGDAISGNDGTNDSVGRAGGVAITGGTPPPSGLDQGLCRFLNPSQSALAAARPFPEQKLESPAAAAITRGDELLPTDDDEAVLQSEAQLKPQQRLPLLPRTPRDVSAPASTVAPAATAAPQAQESHSQNQYLQQVRSSVPAPLQLQQDQLSSRPQQPSPPPQQSSPASPQQHRQSGPPPSPREQVPSPSQPQQRTADRTTSADGVSIGAEDTEMQPAKNPAEQSGDEGAAGSPEGGGAAISSPAAGNQQDAIRNLDEIVAALPPGPIHVTVAVRVGAGGGRRPRGGGARVAEEDMRSGYMRGHACGVFDVPRYLAGRDCIHNGNRWMSRSHFEKVGGSKMAKWYRSIRVLPDLEPLGEWLERHSMPVTKGPARRSRKRAAESGDEQPGQGPEQEGASGSPGPTPGLGGAPMLIDTVPAAASVPSLPAVPTAAAGLPQLTSMPSLTQLAPLPPLAQLPQQAAAAVNSRSAGHASAVAMIAPQPDVERLVDVPLDVLAQHLLQQPRRGMDRKFMQALLNTLPQSQEQQLHSRNNVESAAGTAEEEHDHGTYGPPGAYVDYSAYGGTRNQGAMRTGAGASAVSRGAGAPGTAEAKLLAAAQAMLGSDATTISAIAAAMAAARYHRSGDLPPGELPTDMPRLRWRALHRSQSSSDPMSSSPTLHLDLQDLQHARDLEDGHENPNRGSRQALRQELQLQQQQQHQLQQQLQQQLHQQQQLQLLRRFMAQQQLAVGEEDYYYGDEAE